MLHHRIESAPLLSGDHYAVGTSQYNTVLLQTQEYPRQARIQMTAEEAEHCAALLLEAAKKIRAASKQSTNS